MTTDPETLRQLLARVEGAAGADREIDAEIALTFQIPNEHYNAPLRRPVLSPPQHHRPGLLEYVEISGVSARPAPEYTASVDAALALVGRVMPGWELLISDEGDEPDKWVASMGPRHTFTSYEGVGPTPALALLAALLRAKIAETDNG